MKIIIITECGQSSNCTQGYRLHQPGKPCCVQFWRTEILKAFSDSFACTVRSCRQLAQNAHIHIFIHTHTYKSDNLIYHCTLSGTETGAPHTCTHIRKHPLCVCARLCVVLLVRPLVASQNRSWNYGCECSVPYFRPFMSALLVPGNQASQAGHPSRRRAVNVLN